MKTDLQSWRKISIVMLLLAIVLYTGGTIQKTGAWFVDAGVWVEAKYGIGVIDYTVYIDGKDIGKVKEGQKVWVAVPIIGAAKINDSAKPVTMGAMVHDEFDEAVTLVRTKIVNKGGLPVGISVAVDSVGLTGSGILSMVVPYGHTVVPDQYGVKRTSDGAVENYKAYIEKNAKPVEHDWGNYTVLQQDIETYLENMGSGTTKHRVVAYPGKLPSVSPDQVTAGALGLT
ncbi:MAG: hypothetical protein RRY25_06215, partial [Anaerovorax sp.]